MYKSINQSIIYLLIAHQAVKQHEHQDETSRTTRHQVHLWLTLVRLEDLFVFTNSLLMSYTIWYLNNWNAIFRTGKQNIVIMFRGEARVFCLLRKFLEIRRSNLWILVHFKLCKIPLVSGGFNAQSPVVSPLLILMCHAVICSFVQNIVG